MRAKLVEGMKKNETKMKKNPNYRKKLLALKIIEEQNKNESRRWGHISTKLGKIAKDV
mgnify:CR=1 FL=1